jgi:inosine-uridine nucleoside N-ribohydrolase
MLGRMATAPFAGRARPTILLDCDPGHDDAIALVVAAAHTDLVGITTVHGNAPLTATTRNAIIVRDLLGLDVPVHSGAARGLLTEPYHAPGIHGTSGLDGADLPEPSGPPASTDAVSFIIETCRATEGIWLVPTGPLTNIALALRAAPDLAGRIAGISVMGGGTYGNHTAAAEFNILCDPEAAAVVFAYGGPLVMAGLHLTHQLQATPERIEAVRTRPGRLAAVLADLLTFFSNAYLSLHDGFRGAPVHDVAAVLALTHPHLFDRRQMHVVVETAGQHTRGMTLIDQRPRNDVPAPNADVLWTADADAVFEVITAAI